MSQTLDLRVGIDLCSADEVADAIAEFGDHYLSRIYTDHELATCTAGDGPQPERLAARFAAKEATVKALRPADTGLDLHSIEVTTQPGGWSEITLSGAAADLAERSGIHSLALSLTHERGMAAAVVVAQVRSHDTTTTKGEPDVH